MFDFLYLLNVLLNYQIIEEEIRKVVMKVKVGKLCGIDEFLYEVFKFDCIIKVLYQMFMLFFESGIIFLIWCKVIISLILKDLLFDLFFFLNYCGISFFFVVVKIYSFVLNNRFVIYLDDNNLLVDE